jgi:hypothetical protein
LDSLPWQEESESTLINFQYDAKMAEEIIFRLNPLDYHHRFSTLQQGGFLATKKELDFEKRALVAAADLRDTYKATDMLWTSESMMKPYVLHTQDDPHLPIVVDTGASATLTPNVSDFIGPINPPNFSSLQGRGSPSDVDGQGITEWQVRDVLGFIRTIRTHGYLVKSSPVRLFNPHVFGNFH